MKLYVGNLSFQTSENDLRDTFSEFGNVNEVAIINDRETGRSRGFGFVTMANAADGQRAVDGLHGKSVGGRNLTVNEAKPMEARAPRREFSGGGSGGGGGGRGGDRGGDRGDRGGYRR